MQQLKDDLNQYGIILQSLQLADTIQIKYEKVKKQINSLQPMDYLIVEEKYQKLFIEHIRDKKRMKQLHKLHEEQHQKKQQQAYQKYNKDSQNELKNLINSHKKESININISNNIANTDKIDISNNNNIADSNNNKNSTIKQTQILQPSANITQSRIQKFKRDVKDLQQQNELYQDKKQFPHNVQSLGEMEILKREVSRWRRPNQNQNFIMGAGMSPDDVKQGKIGDCYLISSFAVLGDKYLHKCIGIQEKDNQKIQLWKNNKGAYLVRFYKFLMPVYIQVDDYLPVDDNGQWVFARSQQKDQFWPGIIQKAYAKLYKSYSNIVSGKCHQVLAQFTGGFPFQIIVSEYANNPAALWAKLINSKQKGYLFAAGSLQHDLGDKAFSKRGIVFGHAYSILNVREVQQYKLIQLKNPHGSAGREWTGDFSDNSAYMKPRMRTLLKHQKKNDGIFWMKLQDFVSQFKSLYICCIFEQGWKNFGKIFGQWVNQDTPSQKQNSFGRIQKAQHPQLNYQIGLTVHRNCTLFISLTQQNKTSLQGKNYISFRVQRNDGKRIHKADNQSEGECSTPMNPTGTVTVSQEVSLTGTSFPYTFTIYLACQDRQNKDKKDKQKQNQKIKTKIKKQLDQDNSCYKCFVMILKRNLYHMKSLMLFEKDNLQLTQC